MIAAGQLLLLQLALSIIHQRDLSICPALPLQGMNACAVQRHCVCAVPWMLGLTSN